jgi:hypothetical protein
MRCALQPNNAVPIGNVHVHALVLGREQDSIVSNEMASFLQFIQALLEPMLGRHDVFEQLPLSAGYDGTERQLQALRMTCHNFNTAALLSAKTSLGAASRSSRMLPFRATKLLHGCVTNAGDAS